jgi:hypothetical protein
MAGADAGHGIVGCRLELCLGMPHSDWSEPAFGSLSCDALRDRVLDSPAATKVVILDCCYSGRAGSTALSDDVGSIVCQLGVDGTYPLTSVHSNQVSLALPDEDHTAFTGRLLRLLTNGIPGGPELLTVDDLYRQLLATMTREGLPAPERRFRRPPVASRRRRCRWCWISSAATSPRRRGRAGCEVPPPSRTSRSTRWTTARCSASGPPTPAATSGPSAEEHLDDHPGG